MTIVERGTGPGGDRRSCGLVDLDDLAQELARGRSLTNDLGEVDIFTGEQFYDGMTDPFHGYLEFFCQIRTAELIPEPSIEWSWPFLWFWRAFRNGNSWVYRDEAGLDVELARLVSGEDGALRIDVAAMALRHYMYRRHRALLVGFDLNSDHPGEDAVDREQHTAANDWASVELVVFEYEAHDPPGQQASVWVNGQYAVLPAIGSPGPRWCTDHKSEPGAGVEFIYDVDQATGQNLTVTSTVANTGTDGALGPHGFTRILFRWP